VSDVDHDDPRDSPHDRPLAGQVAVVTGAARGQGRSHAKRLAADGAAIIAVDLCAELATTAYTGATREDLDETASAIRADGGAVYAVVADTRDLDALGDAVTAGLDALRAAGLDVGDAVDIVVANAGIAGGVPIELMSAAEWREMIDVDLTGVWNTARATVPAMLASGRGGSIVVISSANGGLKAPPNLSHYAAAKHGVVGLVRSLANELGPAGIRVNSVHPTAVDTAMIHNDFTYRLFRPDLESPGRDDVVELFRSFHSLPVPWIDASDVSEAVAFLASDAARYITGICLPIDAGLSSR
jgi:SDR family mycofactocin-dependent oxidoreductase